MQSNWSRLLIVTLCLAFLGSAPACGAVPTQMTEVTSVPSGVEVIDVTESNTITNEIIQEKMFNQCDSASPLKAQIQFSNSSAKTGEDELVLTGGASGEFAVSGAVQIGITGAIERHFRSAVSASQEHQEMVEIEVSPRAQEVYTIVWREMRREGTVKYRENGDEKAANYSYRTGLELVSASAKNTPCPGQVIEASATETPVEAAIPTNTVAPTTTPDGSISQVFQVKGETATWGPLETGIYVQAGDKVQITYLSGEWWIGQKQNNDWVSQTPTDGNGYQDRENDRVSSMLGVENPNRCRPLVSAPFGSLIGSIEKEGALFLIGNATEFLAQDSGILYLRINYYDHNKETNCPYGDGGVVTVRVNVSLP